jgi:transcriptional regulator
MPIEHIEGAWKMIQHHPEGNRKGVIEGLSISDKAGDIAVSEVMQDLEIKRKRNP